MERGQRIADTNSGISANQILDRLKMSHDKLELKLDEISLQLKSLLESSNNKSAPAANRSISQTTETNAVDCVHNGSGEDICAQEVADTAVQSYTTVKKIYRKLKGKGSKQTD